MINGEDKHAFVSYVREDRERVDELCRVLEAADIPYWRDLEALAPGDAWKSEIRKAIQSNALVFLACFSEHTNARDRSEMNEELRLAIEEWRRMPPGRVWLIPIRFAEVQVPDWDLGAGQLLSDVQYVDLFGERHPSGAASLVASIQRLIGQTGPTSSASRGLADVPESQRPQRLAALTRQWLGDPTRQIDLDDLISQEAKRVIEALQDESSFPVNLDFSNEDQAIVQAAQVAQKYWEVTKPFCESLRLAARWGKPDELGPWSRALKALLAFANKPGSGNTLMLSLRHIPGATCMMVCALATVSTSRWQNLRALVVDPKIAASDYNNARQALVVSSDLWSPFRNGDIVACTFARSQVVGEEYSEALAYYRSGNGKYYEPFAEWLHQVLSPMFGDQFHDPDDFDEEFDRAEVFMGALAADQHAQAAKGKDRTWVDHSGWFGRATYRSRRRDFGPIQSFLAEIESEGRAWPPLHSGLFGSDPERARAAFDEYATEFATVSGGRF